MAFRFYGGQTPAPSPWKCPSCGAENTTPLAGGCQRCGVGADARHVGQEPVKPREPAQVNQLRPGEVATTMARLAVMPKDAAFEAWVRGRTPLDMVERPLAKAAFFAGIDWALSVQSPAPLGDPREQAVQDTPEGATLYITHDRDAAPQELDERTRQTILAALAFYRDNQLGYGAVPGQLSAQEVSELIGKLEPAAEEG